MERDLQGVMAVVDAARRGSASPGHLPHDVLAALRALVPCDDLSYLDLDVATCTTHVLDEYDGVGVTSLRGPLTEPDDPFWQHFPHTWCSLPTRTGDDRTVRLRSDFHTVRQWRAHPMVVDTGSTFEHEVLVPLPTVGTRSRRLVLFRSGRAFDERDRAVLTLLRPHLVELLDRRTAGPQGLTDRQVAILRLVALGRSNPEIAAELHLSPHTVRKHLENAFERLGVTTRAAAVARVFAA